MHILVFACTILLPYTNRELKFQHYYRRQQPHINPLAPIGKYNSHVTCRSEYTSHTRDGYLIIIIIIIIIIFIYCNWVVTGWQWLFYMYTKYEIGYY